MNIKRLPRHLLLPLFIGALLLGGWMFFVLLRIPEVLAGNEYQSRWEIFAFRIREVPIVLDFFAFIAMVIAVPLWLLYCLSRFPGRTEREQVAVTSFPPSAYLFRTYYISCILLLWPTMALTLIHVVTLLFTLGIPYSSDESLAVTTAVLLHYLYSLIYMAFAQLGLRNKLRSSSRGILLFLVGWPLTAIALFVLAVWSVASFLMGEYAVLTGIFLIVMFLVLIFINRRLWRSLESLVYSFD